MATVSKVEDLSSEDRKVVVSALSLALASANRAARSAKSDAVRVAFEAEASNVASLIARFR